MSIAIELFLGPPARGKGLKRSWGLETLRTQRIHEGHKGIFKKKGTKMPDIKNVNGYKRDRSTVSPDIEEIGRDIVDAAYKVHSTLSPGLLESAYQACLSQELIRRGLKVVCEVTLLVTYEGTTIEAGYRVDMLVEDQIIIENKATDHVLPIYQAQLLTYLRLKGC